MLRRHMVGMYHAWMTGRAPPPPPPSFLDAALTQTPDTMPDDPPYSPDPPTYLQAHDAQYYPSEVAHKVSYSYKQGPRDEPQVENEKSTGRKGKDGASTRLKGIEQPSKNKQGMGDQGSVSHKELSMSPDVHLPAGFKVPKFNLLDGYGDPVAHLRDYCSKMRSVSEKDDLLMAHFNTSLTGAALEWHNHQDINKWPTIGDMGQDFVRHFQYNIDIVPDHSSLSHMEKKPKESFRDFWLRWNEQVARNDPPIDRKDLAEPRRRQGPVVVLAKRPQPQFQPQTYPRAPHNPPHHYPSNNDRSYVQPLGHSLRQRHGPVVVLAKRSQPQYRPHEHP
ncbi:uncharacterized protein LOC142176447 [Nicotiana tabacum]|uniref:Uncharacterized protein LOC142176447 n=2 Tax=Nicotiana tabacum TaxID=4097 RepID=A0AC58TSZ2_TOBAC